MDTSQLLDIQEELDRLRVGGEGIGDYVCNLCVDLAEVTGAGVMLISGDTLLRLLIDRQLPNAADRIPRPRGRCRRTCPSPESPTR